MFGIYVHWPFCLSKCPYCDFNSHVAESVDHPRWRAALLRELAWFAALKPGATVTSVFFGGGTPSLMEPATVAALLDAVAGHWKLADDLEITLEANPGAAEAGRFRDFRAAGVNRLSLGVQALDDSALRALGRRHDLAEALAALDLAAGTFGRFSFDLIYARPGQTVTAWEAELGRALALAGDHLSLYQLTIEEGTAFFPLQARGALVLPDEDTAAGLFELTQRMCAAAGLPAYEVSNHARPGGESRHNLTYWRGGDYVGIGPGAHGRLNRQALRQHRAPEAWLNGVERDGHATRAREALDPETRAEELVMMGLRLTAGIDAATFEAAAELPLASVVNAQAVERLAEAGLVERTKVGLRATPAGMLLLNRVIAELLS
ncbi:radical SAM family heme chaperone HemW [Magnetospirillum sp. UT-4]|uniref:radical SAM family heme chaperone HemW n=1 Tax=Magnetospirillum sp. UT-4 TaxID=2681467 RepID=UPI001382061F|nr:radical SAM family heme chaperone HemW [Magnetospirillum sp. UT-4]CAA7617299.1 Oxygen-independent coproporphyrinogen III oxidase [Magnetospirillum sp. UT-4]